jgi:hypothetical protein
MLFGGGSFALRQTSARAIVVAEVHAFARALNRMVDFPIEELLKRAVIAAKIANIAFGQFVRNQHIEGSAKLRTPLASEDSPPIGS